MPLENADTSAAAGLQDTLKEFDAESITGGDPLADIFGEMDRVISGDDTPPKEDGEEAPEQSDDDPPKKEEPAKEDEAEDADEEEEEDDPPKEDEKAEASEEDDEPAKIRSEDWKRLRSEKDEFKEQAAAAQREIAELNKKLAELPDLREKAKFVEEAEKELAISRVTGTREYKETVHEPLARIEAAAEVIAKDTEVSVDRLIDALAEPDPAKRRSLLKTVTADMDTTDQNEVMQMARDTQELLARKAKIMDQAAEAAKEAKALAEQRQQEAEARTREEYHKAASHVVGELAKRMPFDALRAGEEPEQVAEWLESKINEVPFDEAPADRKAFSVAAGILLPRVNKMLREANEKIATLEARVTKSNKKRPKIGSTKTEAPVDDADGDLDQAVANFFGTQKTSLDITHLVKP